MPPGDPQSVQQEAGARFATTHWSVIVAASQPGTAMQDEALATLCQSYWRPVYAYIRRRGKSPEDAQDLTQEFFARLLAKEWLSGIEPRVSRFRSFLLTAVSRFMANEYDRQTAIKRGGGIPLVPLEEAEALMGAPGSAADSPERAYDRRWALSVLGRAWSRLQEEMLANGKSRHFSLLGSFLSREAEPSEYARLAVDLGVSPGAVGVAVHRLRQRYRDFVRAEVTQTLQDPSMAEDELRYLMAALKEDPT